jgi:hypothetical protein
MAERNADTEKHSIEPQVIGLTRAFVYLCREVTDPSPLVAQFDDQINWTVTKRHAGRETRRDSQIKR